MSWFLENVSDYFANFCVKILKCGPIPKHVGLILDGNRRYAKKLHQESSFGHHQGVETLKMIANWCNLLGISELTVYAFSIENYKRDEDEVGGLFKLMDKAFKDVVARGDIEVRLIGNIDLLPSSFAKSFANNSLKTVGKQKFLVNVAISYTSRDEITNAIKVVKDGVENGHLFLDDIDEKLLQQCLYVPSKLDLLIRTSGEQRFSDFLLWQLKNSQVFFMDVMWPAFTVWGLLACIFKYQANLKHVKFDDVECPRGDRTRKALFLELVEKGRIEKLQRCADS